MKLFVFSFFLILSVMVAYSVALKNPICYQPHSYNVDLQKICFGTKTMWSFNKRSGKCEDFPINPACGGNDNLFDTKEICEKACVFTAVDREGNLEEPQNCIDPHSDTGLCRGDFTSWTYNQDAKQCVEFTYGGCMGNGNRFTYYEECASLCLL